MGRARIGKSMIISDRRCFKSRLNNTNSSCAINSFDGDTLQILSNLVANNLSNLFSDLALLNNIQNNVSNINTDTSWLVNNVTNEPDCLECNCFNDWTCEELVEIVPSVYPDSDGQFCIPYDQLNVLIIINNDSNIRCIEFPSQANLEDNFIVRLVNASSNHIVVKSDVELRAPGFASYSDSQSLYMMPGKAMSWFFIRNGENSRWILYDYLGKLNINKPVASENFSITLNTPGAYIFDNQTTVQLNSNARIITLINNIHSPQDIFAGLEITCPTDEVLYYPFLTSPSMGSDTVILPPGNSITFVKVKKKWIGINTFYNCGAINLLYKDKIIENEAGAGLYICNSVCNIIDLPEALDKNVDFGFVNNTESAIKIRSSAQIKEGLISTGYSIPYIQFDSNKNWATLVPGFSIAFRYVQSENAYYTL
jgi:hypothetical protein